MNKIQLLITASVAVTIMTAISGCDKEKDTTNKTGGEPVACFAFSRDTIYALDTFMVNASCSQDADTYTWSAPVADPHDTVGERATFFAYQSGNIDITLTATNSKGTDTITKSIYAKLPDNGDYVSTYSCTDTCNGVGNSPFTIAITADGDDKVLINGLFSDPTKGSISSSGTISINHISGIGVYNSYGGLNLPALNILTLSTTYSESGNLQYTCNTVCIKY